MRPSRAHRTGILIVVALAAPAAARGEDEGEDRRERRSDVTLAEVFAGPFTSTRLFQMPVADVVGPYRLSVSYDGSLLDSPGVLSSAGVVATGFGDIAQLEYRHTSAISLDGASAPVPAVGVQAVLPLPDREGWPAVAGAIRLGVPRRETRGDIDLDERVSDLYLVTRLRLGRPTRGGVTLHAGARVSQAVIEVTGLAAEDRYLLLPAAGLEVHGQGSARLVTEFGWVPAFEWDPDRPELAPRIGRAVQGRLGIRWHVHPALSLDASLGYQVEAAAFRSRPERGPGAVVDWDIRLGGELFLPWGGLTCRALGVFCE